MRQSRSIRNGVQRCREKRRQALIGCLLTMAGVAVLVFLGTMMLSGRGGY